MDDKQSAEYSGSSSDEEEEEEYEEEEEEERAKDETKPQNSNKAKKKRKHRPPGHRRNIKSKYDTIEDLNPEALSAQTEELERIRRLELQQSLISSMTHDTSHDIPVTSHEAISNSRVDSSSSNESSNVVIVDLTEDDEDTPTNQEEILLDETTQTPSERAGQARKVLRKYDVFDTREDGQVLVNFNHPPYEVDVLLAPQIARAIKLHQIGGIRFLYDNIIESLTRYETSDGFGCILAHSMGLGKTLQVIAFIEVFLRMTSARLVLCIVPVNTLLNWLQEFDKWLPVSGSMTEEGEVFPRNFTLYMLNENVRSMENRYEIITRWYKMGGVLLIGYEMYRLLSLSVPSIGGNKMAVKRKKRKKISDITPTTIDLDETEKEMDNLIEIQQALCKPGPDMVICDEGHRIKNDATNLSQALKRIRTKRRIVMTGYPLQNNLLEYWCMVDFVRPKYLGTKQEFLDLFERPITNGQCIDSTPADVRLMKYRSHVLHKLLEGFVLRRGHEILHSVLPPKFEHVLLMRSSHVQNVLYDFNVVQTQNHPANSLNTSIGPLKAFAVCTKIWNHPDIYYEQSINQKIQQANLLWLAEEGLPPSLSSDTSCKLEWPQSSLFGYETGILENGPKMVILLALLELSVAFGDKVLIFSQSLPMLSYIEKVLSEHVMPLPNSGDITGSYKMSDIKWSKGRHYYRLDGSTSSSERDRLISQFNSPSNLTCWAFLLSTKAGCLGVNLVGANRVIVVDVSWNPCYDSQAVCRVYRYGQTKPCYIYRLVSDCTMEKKMYDRQVSKQGMADRVVDELNPERHFTANDILSLLSPMGNQAPPTDLSSHANEYLFDPVMMQILRKHGTWLTKLPFKHESLLIDSEDEKLTEVEKYVAMKNFQQQLITMRKGPAIVSSSHVYPPHSQPVLYPTVRPTHQGFQNILPGQSNVHLNLARPSPVSIPNSTEKQSNEMEVICLDSDSDSESNNSVSQSQNQPHSLTPVADSALSSNITGRSLNTQYENEIISSKPTSNNPLTQVTTGSSLSYSTLSTQLTTSHPILTQTMSPSPMLPGVASLIKPTSDASQQGHTPSEAAVAQALAGFVQFQRQLCKQLQEPPGAITQSQSTLKSPAMSQLQLQGQVNPTLSAAANISSLSSSCVEPFSHSTVVTAAPTMSPGIHKPNTTIPQLPVKPVLQTSQTSFPLRNCSSQTVMIPCSSNVGQVSKDSSTSAAPLYALVNSLQQSTSGVSLSSPRKAAIVPPISHRPPSTSTQMSSQPSTMTGSFVISTPDNIQAMSSLIPYSSSS